MPYVSSSDQWNDIQFTRAKNVFLRAENLKKTLRYHNDVVGLDDDILDLFATLCDGIDFDLDNLFNSLLHANDAGLVP